MKERGFLNLVRNYWMIFLGSIRVESFHFCSLLIIIHLQKLSMKVFFHQQLIKVKKIILDFFLLKRVYKVGSLY